MQPQVFELKPSQEEIEIPHQLQLSPDYVDTRNWRFACKNLQNTVFKGPVCNTGNDWCEIEVKKKRKKKHIDTV